MGINKYIYNLDIPDYIGSAPYFISIIIIV